MNSTSNNLITCKNCQHEFSGNFCSNCGQRVIRQFTVNYLWSSLHSELFDIDNGLWHTMRDMTLRPSVMIKSFLNGKTKSYFGPLKYMIVVFSFIYLLIQVGIWFGHDSTLFDSSWRQLYFFNSHKAFTLEAFNDLNMALIPILMQSLTQYFILLLPFMAFSSKLIIKKFSFTEHLIIWMYLWTQAFVLGVPLYFLFMIPVLMGMAAESYFVLVLLLSMVLLFFFFAKTYKNLTESTWVKAIIQFILAMYAGYLPFFGIIVLLFMILKLILVG